MTALRHHLLRRRGLAALLVAFALAMRLVVPSGFVLGPSGGSVTIELCSGHGPEGVAMAGMAGKGGEKGEHGRAERPCAFAGLGVPSLAGADPIPLLALVAFVMGSVFRPMRPTAASAPAFLRPPMRGPPVPA